MKKVALLAMILAGMSVSAFSQEKNSKPERMKLYPVQQETKTFASVEEEIAYCEQHLAALDAKEEWIRQNPEELKIATENGWFVKTEETRKELKARLIELKK